MLTPYLTRRTLFGPLVTDAPHPGLGLVVVIPCYDEPDLIGSLESLAKCDLPECATEVLVMVNESEKAPPEVLHQNEETVRLARRWVATRQERGRKWNVYHAKRLPARQAGVGLARKIGMDEACRRLEQAGRPDGLIVCFDADSRCEVNYLQAVEQYFRKHPDIQIAAIHFEHPLEGGKFPQAVYRAVIDYELHLRYFVQVQRWAGFPHAVHTIGSSMAVRANAYQAQGGMNRRKAGEDFYFFHKFTPLQAYGKITDTKIIPSPRPSHRVPFGTGRDVQIQLKSEKERTTYAPRTFMDLRPFMGAIPLWWDQEPDETLLPKAIKAFLQSRDWQSKLEEAREHTASQKAFAQRFFRWFNAFQLMKYAHFARDQFYPDVPVGEASAWLLAELGKDDQPATNKKLLEALRMLDLQP